MKVSVRRLALVIGVVWMSGGCLESGGERPSPEFESEVEVDSRTRAGDREPPETEASSGRGDVSGGYSDESSDGSESSSGASDRHPEVRRGEALFEAQCATCHGGDARGTRSGPSLHPIADRLADGEGESTVRRQLAGGGRRMPAFSHLEDGQTEALIAYLGWLGADESEAGAAEGPGTPVEADEGTRGRRWKQRRRRRRGGWRRRGKGERGRRHWRKKGDDEGDSDGRDPGRAKGCRMR